MSVNLSELDKQNKFQSILSTAGNSQLMPQIKEQIDAGKAQDLKSSEYIKFSEYLSTTVASKKLDSVSSCQMRLNSIKKKDFN